METVGEGGRVTLQRRLDHHITLASQSNTSASSYDRVISRSSVISVVTSLE